MNPIARMMGPTGEPRPAEQAARDLWHKYGGVSFTAAQLDRMETLPRMMILAAAIALYGKRRTTRDGAQSG